MSSTRLISNRYYLVKHIGQGGMADVYIAMDSVLNREVAIKVLRGELSSDPVALLRFQREANASAKLSHPNIVEIYDVGEDQGRHYIVMEYIRGKTLKQIIQQRGPLHKEEAVDMMKQLVAATQEAHRQGIIHRDIKPQNVLVKDDGTLKMVDFGIALAQDSLQLTQSDSIMGSVHYLAPELAKGQPASSQSDIYSLGIVFFEMMTGQLPYHGEAAVQVAIKHMREEIPSVRELNPLVPQSIENIILKATAKNVAYRYRGCASLLRDLNTCLMPTRLNEPKLDLASDQVSAHTVSMRKIEEPRKATASRVQQSNNAHRPSVSPRAKAKPKKNGLPWILGGIAAIVLTICLLLLLQLSGFLKPLSQNQQIPDLLNMTLQEAKEACQQANVLLDTSAVQYVLTEDVEKGKIIDQTPEANTNAEKGARVTVTISSGIYAVMDDYVGQEINAAKKDLMTRYPNVRVIVTSEESDEAMPGEIIRQQSLLAGDKFDPSRVNEIHLVFAAYDTFVIPHKLDGMDVFEAQSLLESMGAQVMLSVLEIPSDLSEEELANLKTGVVIRTSPGLGTSYTQEAGNHIVLYYY